MKTAKLTLLIFPLLVFMPRLVDAQQMRSMEFDASSSLMLREFSAVLVSDKSEIKVELTMGQNHANSGEDQLEQGDIILMMNGKRATDIETLRSIYESITEQEEIKIGVRRGDERFILNAVKGDIPKGGPRMMMSFDTDDGPAPAIVPEMGVLLVDRDNKVIVERMIPPMLPDELKSLDIQSFTLKLLNGEHPENATSVKTKLEGLEIGAQISVLFEKDGEEKSVTYIKKEAKSSFSISTNNN